MASFSTACQSGDPRAGWSAGACGLTCAPCGSPGANCCCNRSATKICFPSTPVSTPRTTARNGRSVPDEHRPVFRTQKPASVMVLAAVIPVSKSLWFSYTRGRKNQQGNLNRDQATLEQALKPWAEETHGDSHGTFQQDGANWSGSGHTARATQKRREKISFLHHQGPVAPSSTDLKPIDYTMWSVLEKEAWSKPHKKIWSVNDRRSQKQSCVPPSETS